MLALLVAKQHTRPFPVASCSGGRILPALVIDWIRRIGNRMKVNKYHSLYTFFLFNKNQVYSYSSSV